MASVERSLGMVDYYAMLEIEPGASKTAALHAYYSMRHALLTLGYDQDCQELRDVWKLTTPYHLTTLTSGSSLRPRTLLTDEEERMYYEEEYYIALCAQEDCDGVLEDGDIFSFSSALEVLEANLHWRAAERFVSDNESEIDGDLDGSDACDADDIDMDEEIETDDLVDEVDAEPEEGSVDYVRYGCGYEAGSL
ncbi:hypothetical protein LTR91_016513 [Friedmanniomyces endolithicus]|uniref:Uncharacterized protein n=1 Tax=Friedmanniomyces endolithicus TaxID=329885 RepID=A0AAN6K887_9PEZI|nr:hypothetical protein LTR38_012963 [Friedmanniomyces endolithicus]KAK0785958.1 hypothetical protein LTR59_010872 [Friedmanniomyces endolithicus]KAK0801566.1 hypothetical protein LTR75_008545 [Friedmanniomyces endolithicus]KAK0851106.1 hypothetical protein LTR03_004173 [Friedmanniomyces endolithicus]KAK0864608.1 hypothetical protein LTS02_005841 [Friedmanniomyces endolithicus]